MERDVLKLPIKHKQTNTNIRFFPQTESATSLGHTSLRAVSCPLEINKKLTKIVPDDISNVNLITVHLYFHRPGDHTRLPLARWKPSQSVPTPCHLRWASFPAFSSLLLRPLPSDAAPTQCSKFNMSRMQTPPLHAPLTTSSPALRYGAVCSHSQEPCANALAASNQRPFTLFLLDLRRKTQIFKPPLLSYPRVADKGSCKP